MELRRAAFHEAGHAIATLTLGVRVSYVSIRPDPAASSLGRCAIAALNKVEVWRSVVIALAGPAAEQRHSGEPSVIGERLVGRARPPRGSVVVVGHAWLRRRAFPRARRIGSHDGERAVGMDRTRAEAVLRDPHGELVRDRILELR